MSQLDLVFEVLKGDLSASRILLKQVSDGITDRYGFTSTELPQFFAEKYTELEDYEVDLLFSPQFTPTEHNRLEYIPLLGEKALSGEEIKQLKQRLQEAQLQISFKTYDELVEITVPVHEVFIDRYVNLLKLDHGLPTGLYQAILEHIPHASRHEVNLLARDAVWQSEPRQALLQAFLKTWKQRDNFTVPKLNFLTQFLRTYRPKDTTDLAQQLQSLVESCRKDMENVSGRGFHDEYLKALHAGSAFDKSNETNVWAHYQNMMDFAQQLLSDHQTLAEQVY